MARFCPISLSNESSCGLTDFRVAQQAASVLTALHQLRGGAAKCHHLCSCRSSVWIFWFCFFKAGFTALGAPVELSQDERTESYLVKRTLEHYEIRSLVGLMELFSIYITET